MEMAKMEMEWIFGVAIKQTACLPPTVVVVAKLACMHPPWFAYSFLCKRAASCELPGGVC